MIDTFEQSNDPMRGASARLTDYFASQDPRFSGNPFLALMDMAVK